MECAYDSMGRRFEKKVTVGGTTGFHARYLYRDYLQVAECDLTGETPEVVRSYIWDPSEPEATRVLSMTRWEANGTQEKEHLYCMHDAMKNVTSLFGEACGRRALYEYRPYGGLTRRKATWRKRTNSASPANTWTTNLGWSTTTTGISIRLTAGGSAVIPSRKKAAGICSRL